MRSVFGVSVLLCGFSWLGPAYATVRIDVDLTTQTMHVESSSGSYSWLISSARAGYVTPRGTFRPYSLQTVHFSRKYYDSPMPHSIFFDGGFAIHGTYETAWLGRPASHGCVRIAPQNAALLFEMVKAEGAVIHISGTPPVSEAAADPYWHRRYYAPASYDYPGTWQGWQFDPNN
jgi:lipoprotein-anchoring transpeptidase ErfK/SrfK